MSQEQQDSGATKSAESGAPEDTKAHEQNKATQEEEEKVSKAELKRVLDDLHKYKSKMKQFEEQLNVKDAELQSLNDQRLAEQNDHKTLAQQWKERFEAEKTKNEQFIDSFYLSKRQDAVLAAARKAGLRKEAEADLLSMSFDDTVAIEKTDHGRVIVHGADDWVRKEIIEQRSHWLEQKKAPSFNPGGGKVPLSEKDLNGSTLFELEKAARTGDADAKQRYLEARNRLLREKGLKSG